MDSRQNRRASVELSKRRNSRNETVAITRYNDPRLSTIGQIGLHPSSGDPVIMACGCIAVPTEPIEADVRSVIGSAVWYSLFLIALNLILVGVEFGRGEETVTRGVSIVAEQEGLGKHIVLSADPRSAGALAALQVALLASLPWILTIALSWKKRWLMVTGNAIAVVVVVLVVGGVAGLGISGHLAARGDVFVTLVYLTIAVCTGLMMGQVVILSRSLINDTDFWLFAHMSVLDLHTEVLLEVERMRKAREKAEADDAERRENGELDDETDSESDDFDADDDDDPDSDDSSKGRHKRGADPPEPSFKGGKAGLAALLGGGGGQGAGAASSSSSAAAVAALGAGAGKSGSAEATRPAAPVAQDWGSQEWAQQQQQQGWSGYDNYGNYYDGSGGFYDQQGNYTDAYGQFYPAQGQGQWDAYGQQAQWGGQQQGYGQDYAQAGGGEGYGQAAASPAPAPAPAANDGGVVDGKGKPPAGMRGFGYKPLKEPEEAATPSSPAVAGKAVEEPPKPPAVETVGVDGPKDTLVKAAVASPPGPDGPVSALQRIQALAPKRIKLPGQQGGGGAAGDGEDGDNRPPANAYPFF